MSTFELLDKPDISSYKTALQILYKLRKAMVSSGDFPLTVTMEADEPISVVIAKAKPDAALKVNHWSLLR